MSEADKLAVITAYLEELVAERDAAVREAVKANAEAAQMTRERDEAMNLTGTVLGALCAVAVSGPDGECAVCRWKGTHTAECVVGKAL